MMNKKGNIGLAIVISLFIFICFIGVFNLIKPSVTDFRNGMGCEIPASLSDGSKLVCLTGDLVVVYFILLVLSASIGGLIDKFLI